MPPTDRTEKQAAWRAYGQRLKKALWNNVCVVDRGLQCGWMDGGCFVAARAVARIVGGQLWAVRSSSPRRATEQTEHVIVQTADGAGYLDADGFATAQQMVTRWMKQLTAARPGTTVHLAPFREIQVTDRMLAEADADASEIQCDLDLADDIEARLRAALPVAPSGARRRSNPRGAPGPRDVLVWTNPFTGRAEALFVVPGKPAPSPEPAIDLLWRDASAWLSPRGVVLHDPSLRREADGHPASADPRFVHLLAQVAQVQREGSPRTGGTPPPIHAEVMRRRVTALRARNPVEEYLAWALLIGALLPLVPPPGPGDILDPWILAALGGAGAGAVAREAHREDRSSRHKNPTSYALMEAEDELYGPLMQWIHYPNEGKRRLLAAYERLTPRQKEALARDVLAAFERVHGGPRVTAWRYKGRPQAIGLTSLTTKEPTYLGGVGVTTFDVPASEVMVHWAQPGLPLGGEAFGHEQELILKPDAKVEAFHQVR